MTKTALLTGITGFIGGALAQRLLGEGWHVHAIVRPNSETSRFKNPRLTLHRWNGSAVELARIVEVAQPHVAFHLASLFLADHTASQVEELVRSNILFPTQLAEALTAGGCKRLINTGTAWQHFCGEPYRPVNLYAATKQAFDDVLAYYCDTCGLSVTTLKLFDTYGPHDKRRKLIRILIDAARTGQPLDMSPGEQIVDMTHIDDVVDAYMLVADRMLNADRPLRETYLLSGERHSVCDLVALVGRALCTELTVHFGGRPYRNREVMVPVEVTSETSLPGWRRRRNLESALPTLINQ